MPKKIENIRETALKLTKQALEKEGFESFTMREIAAACGVALGTMYNYFPSKEMLTAAVVYEDWKLYYAEMEAQIETAKQFNEALADVYNGIAAFSRDYEFLFLGDLQSFSSKYRYSERHTRLLAQIEALIRKIIGRFNITAEDFTVTFIAETLINCGVKHYSFSQLKPILDKLLN